MLYLPRLLAGGATILPTRHACGLCLGSLQVCVNCGRQAHRGENCQGAQESENRFIHNLDFSEISRQAVSRSSPLDPSLAEGVS